MMCRLFRIHPSGFYAWLRMPLSKRACEDKRQIDLLQTAWEESGKVYGYGLEWLGEPGLRIDVVLSSPSAAA
ncbi:hypothetical protein ASF29_12060 [Rhizobium sp. Leaf262]|nr:hypothetical protein ASF29_12060 [Rhizobium sp. Leaf262]